jgi:hypothetical protein
MIRIAKAKTKRSSSLPASVAEGAPTLQVPRDSLTKGEQLARNANLALNFVRRLLEVSCDPANLKMLGHQKDAALTIISQQIRVEAEQLREPPARGGSVHEFSRHYENGGGEDER